MTDFVWVCGVIAVWVAFVAIVVFIADSISEDR